MRKYLLALFVLLYFITPTAAIAPLDNISPDTVVSDSAVSDEWNSVARNVLASIVYVESNKTYCTGFVINAKLKYVMTANHCDAPEGRNVWVDRVQGVIISKDTKKDIAIFEVKNLDSKHPALTLAGKDPEIGQEVMSAGFGMNLERPLVRKAMVSDTALYINEDGIGGPLIALDAAFVGGQSGGPVVNKAGEVVMLVQFASGTVGMGVGANTLRERTGRFWGLPTLLAKK